MSDFAFNTEHSPDTHQLDWEVRHDKPTGALAFTNDRAALKILVLPPGMLARVDGQTEGQWTARLISESPYSSMQPVTIATEETEMEVVEKIEEFVDRRADDSKQLLSALEQLQATGLVIESPVSVAADFMAEESTVAQRVLAYLRVGSGPSGTPSVDPATFDPDKLRRTLEHLGMSEAQAGQEARVFQAIAGATDIAMAG